MIASELLAKTTTTKTWKLRLYEWDTRALYVMDLEAQSRYNKMQIETGMATVNDLRRSANIEPVEGGDVVMITCNVAPIGSDKITGGSARSGAESGNGNTNSDGNGAQ